MEYFIYIGAALVIGLLIGIVSLSVLWLRQAMLHNVRSHTLNLLSVMDEILDEKSRELTHIEEEVHELEEEIVHLEEEAHLHPQDMGHGPGAAGGQSISTAAFMAAIERAATEPYRDKAVGDAYRQIRQNFSFHVEDLLPVLSSQSSDTDGAAGRLLKELEFDTVYHLSTLDSHHQLQVLRESLPREGLVLLEAFAEGCGQFNVIMFYDYLTAAAAEELHTAHLYVPRGTPVGAGSRGTVEISEDEDICEGFQLELGGMLYDYCIKTKELG